ncbi:Modification methylase Eco57IB [bioreactor metagenome]|uniref:Modification methylase Eco57IB n=1 Tax=bioreactor metagenome TaxID=1076179 RepID=A0A644XZU4_9ZZZZ
MRYKLGSSFSLESKRSTGSFYTNKKIADYICSWAIRDEGDSILEPSFGDGVFIEAARQIQRTISDNYATIHAVELQEEPFLEYFSRPNITNQIGYKQDFLRLDKKIKVNAVIGNPPYVSLKNVPLGEKETVRDFLIEHDIKIPLNGSMWYLFIVKAISHLLPEGRIGFVLPFEITHVKYAYKLWSILSSCFGKISIIRVHEDFFPEVDVETVILLADQYGRQTETIEYQLFNSVSDMQMNKELLIKTISIKDILTGAKPFLSALLSDSQAELLCELRSKNLIKPLSQLCNFSIGYVCADKEYFHPNTETIKKYELPTENLIPSISGSRQLSKKGIGVTTNRNQHFDQLYLPNKITSGDMRYLEQGRERLVHEKYKCTQREPWYITPSVVVPDFVLTTFGDVPKLLLNSGGFAVSNSLLAGRRRKGTEPERVIPLWYNSITLLSIELNIHSLGGGVLVMIPGEVNQLEIASDLGDEYNKDLITELDMCMKERGIEATYELGDEIVLKRIMGLTQKQIDLIRESIKTLRFWRHTRERRSKSSN